MLRAASVRPPNYLLPASLSHRGSNQVLRLRGCTWMREASSRKVESGTERGTEALPACYFKVLTDFLFAKRGGSKRAG